MDLRALVFESPSSFVEQYLPAVGIFITVMHVFAMC